MKEARCQKTDVEIIDSVVTDWRTGAGGSIVIRAILWLITELRNGYGNNTTIGGVVDALENLSRDAKQVRLNLKAEYIKEHPEENLPFTEENMLLLHMLRNLHATIDHLQRSSWWQEKIPLPIQHSFNTMLERSSQAPVIDSIDQLRDACQQFAQDAHDLGNLLSLAPNQYTESCVQWMCFQVANVIPKYIFNLVADESAKAEARITALEQANEWMKKVATNVHKCK